MICPRCGRSTPGNVCPYCDRPQIEDYTDDYIKRKKEYESVTGMSEASENKTAQEEGKKQVSFRKFIIPVAIAAAAATAAMIAVNVIRDYRPALEYKGDVFYTLNGNYYRLAGEETEEIGDSRTIFLNGDGRKYYKSDAVFDLLSKDTVKTDKTMTDDKGGYFACSVYDSSVESENYKLFVWSKDKEPSEMVSSNGMIGIKYISDTGKIFFTKTDVITEELGTGGTSLWCCDIDSGDTIKLEDNIYSVNVYSKAETMIIRDKDDSLHLRKTNELSHRVRIADGVTELLAEEKGCNNSFRTTDAVVNTDESADRFCYGMNNRIYMYDISFGDSVDIGSVVGSDGFVSYDDVNRVVYLADSKSVTCGVMDGGRINNKKKLDDGYMSGGIIWNDHKKTLLFLSSDGKLKKIVDRQASAMSDIGGIKSLLNVQNDGGYVCVTDRDFYYGSAFDKEPVSLGEIFSENITSVIRSKDYVYRLEGRQLIASKEDGTYTKNMGECENLWCGEL